MKKKLLSLTMVVLLVFGMFTAGSVAEDSSAAAEAGKLTFDYMVKGDGTAAITGVSNDKIETLEIPAEVDGHQVTSIGMFAFGNCMKLISVTIPEGVAVIGDDAFGNCYMLESINIPDSLVSIGSQAFRSERLIDVRVSPDHPVFAVENKALINKQNMTLVRFLGPDIRGTYEIAQGIRTIGEGAFEFGRLSAVVIPDSVTAIGNEAFSFCERLKSVTIPEGVTSVGTWAFENCFRLESVVIPDSVIEIGPAVFDGCRNLNTIEISPDHPVYECRDLVLVDKEKKAIIAASGTVAGKYAVPDDICAIGSWAFNGCSYLYDLYIPDSVTEIGQFITNSDTVIRACAGSAAAGYCGENSEVRFTETDPVVFGEAVSELKEKNINGKSPDGWIYSWYDEEDVLESGLFQYKVKEDGTAELMKANEFLADGNIPAELDGHRVTSIAAYAFQDCASLETLVIPESVVSVGYSAFWNCIRLESLSIPASVVSVDRAPISGCRKLKTIEVSPDNPALEVSNGALIGKQSRTLFYAQDHEDTGTYTVPQGIKQIGENAFEGCAFSAIILPDGITEIGHQAFSSCKNLKELVLPEGVTTIGIQAFFGSENLESVTIPDSVTSIGDAVFGSNKALTTVSISPDHPVYEMIDHLLVDKRSMKIVSVLNSTPEKYEIPEGIKVIGNMAFQGSRDLAELIVPEGVTEIDYSAFSGCDKLWKITLPASLAEIRNDAFRYSAELLIKAPAGSYAQKYSEEHGYKFEAVD